MNSHETEKLLIEMSAIDNRLVSDLAVVAWSEALADVVYQDGREALLEHRRSSTEYVTPAHIIAGVKRRRDPLRESARRSLAEIADARSRSVPMPEGLKQQMLGVCDG